MGIFPEKRFGKRVCAGCQRRIYTLQKREKGSILMEESAELLQDSVRTLAEYGKKVKKELGGQL